MNHLLRPLVLLGMVHPIHRAPADSKGHLLILVRLECRARGPSGFFRISLRRPSCATIANSFVPSSETPQ